MFVIKNKKTNRYIDVDKPSGGYPYETNLTLCYKWNDYEGAEKYSKLFNKEEWEIEELVMETKPIQKKD